MDDWINTQLTHRFAGIAMDLPALLSSSALAAFRSMPDIALYDGQLQGYTSLNGFDLLCRWDDEKQQFVHSGPRTGRPQLGSRQTQFANLLRSWQMRGLYLSNWCDAQGWDYRTRLPELGSVPLIQYCRRIQQRGQVVLMPLTHHYMGPGGPNLPLEPDPMAFEDKRPQVVWRGNATGILCDWREGKMWWAASVFRPTTQPADLDRFRQTVRWQVVNALRDCPWADVKYAFPAQATHRLKQSPWLQGLLADHVGGRLDMAAQRQCQFLLVVDGNDIGSNKYWSLLSNSVVLMVESDWETALDAGLEAGVHYVSVQPTRESIESAVETLRAQPQRCKEIIAAAHALLRPQLNPEYRDMADYLTLKQYGERLVSTAHLPTQWSFSRR